MRSALKIVSCLGLLLHFTISKAQDTLLIQEVVISAEPYIPPSSTYVQKIDSVKISSYKGRSMSDLLLQQSSVTIKDYGPGGLSTLNVRGTGPSNTQLFWEGFSLNNQMLGQSDLKLFPVFLANQVDLHFGNAGMVDGIGGIGGNIMIHENQSFQEKQLLHVGGRLSSIEERVALLKLIKSTDRWYFGLRSRFENSNNIYDFRNYTEDDRRDTMEGNHTDSYHLNFNSGYKWSEKSTLSLSALFINRQQELSPIIGVQPKGETQGDQSANLMLKYKYESRRTNIDFSSAFMTNDISYENDSLDLLAEHQINSWRTLTGISQKLATGFDLKLVLSTELTNAASDSYEGTKKRTQYAAQTRLVWYKLSRLKSDVLLRTEVIDEELFYLPMISAEYQPLRNFPIWMFASIGKNIRYPTLNELYWEISGNEDLQAQEAITFEAGIQKKSAEKAVVIGSINAFHSTIDNWILWQPQGNVWRPENVRQVRSYGLEGSAGLQFKPNNWPQQINFNYSYTKSEVRENYTTEDNTIGNQLIYTPEHKLSANWRAAIYSGYMIWRVNYSGMMYINPENTAYIPHSAPVDIAFGKDWKWNKTYPLNIQLTCHNLLDEEIQYVAHRTLPGRYFSIDFILGYEK